MDSISEYVRDVAEQYSTNHAREHAYRPALKVLISSFEDVIAVNDPKRSDFGNPDFVFLKASNHAIIRGHAEAKDIDVNLDKSVKTEQLIRYAGYDKLFLTNGIDFRFFQNGGLYESVSIGKLANEKIIFDPTTYRQLYDEIQAFLDLPPEPVKSGKRLAIIMGGKARRIRDNVQVMMNSNSTDAGELHKIYNLMREMLVHDLTHEKFADMYAQTLVYGLFVARYNDKTPESFDRKEARDLVPKSNPFLRHFFDHIVGPDFVLRLGYIVDELCEVFSVSNVSLLVQKHLKLFELENEKDPIIHFYEDFLQEYDPVIRKQMGAYYTPIPVVQFIVRYVDDILKRDFGIPKGLADSSKITKKIEVGQDMRHDRRKKLVTTQDIEFHRVQILDPAVGTATFLNETIKHIAKSFEGQEGRWASYVENNLLERIHGFELMMAPYTIAHLKLGMTLQESGVSDFNKRLGVYLTNTLDEGIPRQQDLFNFGLAQAVSDESKAASEIKHERPVMIVMGNPPYSVSSNNKSAYIQNLIKDYKKDLNERKINLDDDYIKFIRFAEDMIEKNGEGIVAMITNNSYIDGITHRQMRKKLLGTFDKIYILDLHGNIRKNEQSPDGGPDENVFQTIRQGVAIVLLIKKEKAVEPTEVYHAEIYGIRKNKLKQLAQGGGIEFSALNPTAPNYFFTKKDLTANEYDGFVSVDDLFIKKSTGIETQDDENLLSFSGQDLIKKLIILSQTDTKKGIYLATNGIDDDLIVKIKHKPFDERYTYLDSKVLGRARMPFMSDMRDKENYALCTSRQFTKRETPGAIVVNNPAAHKSFSANDKTVLYPLYSYYDDGTRTPNLKTTEINKLLINLQQYVYAGETPITPGDIVTPLNMFDYVYGILQNPSYVEKYKEFLRMGFPKVPIPKDDEEFLLYAEYGSRLRNLHLMSGSELNDLVTTFPLPGDDSIEKITFVASHETGLGSVYINDVQFFGDVPKVVWEFQVGGYLPAQKWLKERIGHTLTNDEIEHYQKIIKVLIETNKLIKNISSKTSASSL